MEGCTEGAMLIARDELLGGGGRGERRDERGGCTEGCNVDSKEQGMNCWGGGGRGESNS